MITAVFTLVNVLLSLFMWAVILSAVVSTLMSFGILDSRNRLVWTIGDFLYRLTDPVLRPVRNLLPNLGGIDISPMIVIVIIWVIQGKLLPAIYAFVETGNWQPLIY